MRILQFIHGLNIGGAETFLYNLLSGMSYQAIDVHFVIQDPIVRNQKLKSLIENRGWSIHVIPMFNKNIIGHYRALNNLFQKSAYDWIHVHMNSMINPIPLICAHRNKVRLIVHSHSSSSNARYVLFGNTLHWVNKHLFQRESDTRLACSSLAGKWMFDGRDYKVAPNAINIESFCYSENNRKVVRDKYAIAFDDIVIGSIARFAPAKNHKGMIDIFEEYHKVNPASYLMLVGDGALMKEIRDYVQGKGLGNRVVFTGAQNDPIPFYSAFDLFLMPSFFEGLGFTAIEAQANGLPIVMSDTIPREVDPLGHIRFISLDDSLSTWRDAISDKLAESRGTERIEGCSRLAHTCYNISHLLKMMMDTYCGTDNY